MVRFEYMGAHVTRLGESPVWDARRERLWWVDAVSHRIASCGMDGGNAIGWTYPQPVGSIGLASNGNLIAALADGFYLIDGESGEASPIARPEGMALPVRFNDGKTDRDGRFLSATMTERDFEARNGALWSLGQDGAATLLEKDFRLGNAICFSPDGTTLYFADSLEGVIRRYRYDRATGSISGREDFLDTKPFRSGPDGATVDSEGRLWVALVQAQSIGCFTPDGGLVRLVDVPLPYPSCPAFGGASLDILFLTGISDSGWKTRAEGPTAGRILAIHGLGATGIEETPYAKAVS